MKYQVAPPDRVRFNLMRHPEDIKISRQPRRSASNPARRLGYAHAVPR
ncbi:hypothetical protein BLL52_0931 [Rhodoferax antarcticus ANT.BR]|uniref:Uncharacterized protein n=1 Tax=Rhodoferax antarcticus ANT.BR TaxID=1111071 RepID=A0A1Q8YID7_9BURK|nr:hypothetical protein BLL52_0931 [Rhodoferax antarcticus ANT.BR]